MCRVVVRWYLTVDVSFCIVRGLWQLYSFLVIIFCCSCKREAARYKGWFGQEWVQWEFLGELKSDLVVFGCIRLEQNVFITLARGVCLTTCYNHDVQKLSCYTRISSTSKLVGMYTELSCLARVSHSSLSAWGLMLSPTRSIIQYMCSFVVFALPRLSCLKSRTKMLLGTPHHGRGRAVTKGWPWH